MQFFKGVIVAILFTLVILILLFCNFTISTALIVAALVFAIVKLINKVV